MISRARVLHGPFQGKTPPCKESGYNELCEKISAANTAMTVPAKFALRAFYTVAGIAAIVYSVALVSSRGLGSVFLPVVLGVLLIVQGISGA